MLILLGLPAIGSPIYFDGRIGVFDTSNSSDHSQKVLSSFSRLSQLCANCRLISYPIYDKDGTLNRQRFQNQLDKAFQEGIRLFHLSWNLKTTKDTLPIVEKLNDLARKGVLIVGAAGSGSGSDNLPLAIGETVLGQIEKNIFIIGESKSPDSLSLAKGSNFGNFFTILYPFKGRSGSSFSAPIFSEQLASYWFKRNKIKADQIFQILMSNKGDRPYPSLELVFSKI